ncbi:MAG TPA: trehalose-phosphatase, partial [Actinomycetes bacterium]|nr:trehalose-phosphatase [Actinomycetes bacterium]
MNGATQPPAEPAPGWGELARQDRALFLDVDGTLIDFEQHPDLVRATEGLILLLTSVSDALGGALALLSGRSLRDIDRVFNPWRPNAAGVHGAEVRGPLGIRRNQPDPGQLARLRASSHELAGRMPGVWVEDKGMSIALHHREAPGAADFLAREAARLAAESQGAFVVQPGVLVQELRPAS